MSVKKMLLLGVASIAAVSMTAAMAGGGYTNEPVAHVADNGYYVEGHVGYGSNDYYNNNQWQAHSGVEGNNSGSVYGGFAGGLDLGYKINQNVAVELGWFHFPGVDVASTDNSGALLPSVYLTNWALYLAAKYMTPLPWINNTNWFFKVGVEYRRADVSTTAIVNGTSTLGISNGSSNYASAMFATGLDYSFTDVWSGIFQYAYFLSASQSELLGASLSVSYSAS